jgi:uncharacterized protein (TIGR03086 family)
MSALLAYGRCLDQLEGALAAVPTDAWDGPSPCQLWSVRDIAGHVIWGQEQMRCWVTGDEYAGMPGGPGTPRPRPIAGADPLPRWRAARAAGDAALGDASLDQTVSLGGLGERPLATMVAVLTTAALIHAWDLRRAVGGDARLPADLVAASQAWARDNLIRMPGFFGPELIAPAGADEQTRWLAFLGRAAWQPAAATT